MIVDPDFLDHWRTGMVADAIGDPMAPIYILRLWAHCQVRKSDRFVMPTAGLKAQCKCPADAHVFEQALIDAGYLERDGEMVVVLGWAEANASLLAAWGNGAKGGRPKKNPTETHGKPTGNPAVAHGEPIANPGETDKSREDKSREEKKQTPSAGASSELSSAPPKGYSSEFETAWSEYPSRMGGNSKADAFKAWEARRRDGASVMELTEGVRRYALFVELAKVEPRFVKQAATFFGPGLHFREPWAPPDPAPRQQGRPLSRQSDLEARNAAVAARILENLNAGV